MQHACLGSTWHTDYTQDLSPRGALWRSGGYESDRNPHDMRKFTDDMLEECRHSDVR